MIPILVLVALGAGDESLRVQQLRLLERTSAPECTWEDDLIDRQLGSMSVTELSREREALVIQRPGSGAAWGLLIPGGLLSGAVGFVGFGFLAVALAGVPGYVNNDGVGTAIFGIAALGSAIAGLATVIYACVQLARASGAQQAVDRRIARIDQALDARGTR